MDIQDTVMGNAANDGNLSSTLKEYSLNPLEKIEIEPFRRSGATQNTGCVAPETGVAIMGPTLFFGVNGPVSI